MVLQSWRRWLPKAPKSISGIGGGMSRVEGEGGWIRKRVFSSVTPSPHYRSIASRHPLPRWWFLHQISSGLSSGPRNKMLRTCPSTRCRERTASCSHPPKRHCCGRGPVEVQGFLHRLFQSCAFSLACCFCSSG